MNIYILIIITFITSCQSQPKGFTENLDNIREDFSKDAKAYNAKILKWNKIVDSIYKISDSDKLSSLRFIDNLLLTDKTLERPNVAELHFIKGQIYYSIDSFENALIEFSENYRSPRLLAAEAGVYIKQHKFDTALLNLKEAAEVNHDYYWNIGNYYEIIGQKDSAISNYQILYQRDTLIYKYCIDRVAELKKVKKKFLKELIFKDNERKVLLMY
jgi:tetratricopeptide (TPR) repeat protein